MEMITEKDLIPGTNYITTRMISDRFNIPYGTVMNRYVNHKDIIDKYGVKKIDYIDFEKMIPKNIGYKTTVDRLMINYEFENGKNISIHRRQNYIFTKEAAENILGLGYNNNKTRIKSKPKVKSDPEPVTDSLPVCLDSKDDDKQLVLKLAEAFSTGDTMKMLDAALKLDQYRIQTISALHAENERLKNTSTSLISWSDRASVSRVIRELAAILEINKNDIWSKLYYKLTVTYKLPLEERRKMPLINAVEYTEWKFVYKALYDICDEKCMDLYRVLEKADVDSFGLELIFKDQHADV